ncbi:hypothetical protein V8G54_001606, partial [Vigna mungo]
QFAASNKNSAATVIRSIRPKIVCKASPRGTTTILQRGFHLNQRPRRLPIEPQMFQRTRCVSSVWDACACAARKCSEAPLSLLRAKPGQPSNGAGGSGSGVKI